MSQPNKIACKSLPVHWQSHQPAQPLRAPGATGLAIKLLVRFGVVWAPRTLACAADALVDALREKSPAAPQAVSWVRSRWRAGSRFKFGHHLYFQLCGGTSLAFNSHRN